MKIAFALKAWVPRSDLAVIVCSQHPVGQQPASCGATSHGRAWQRLCKASIPLPLKEPRGLPSGVCLTAEPPLGGFLQPIPGTIQVIVGSWTQLGQFSTLA